MRLRLESPFGSILSIDACELPDFAVLIGRNGVGKTQLLKGIADRQIQGGVHKSQSIEKHDIGSFRIRSSGRAAYGGSLFAEGTAQRFFSGIGGQSLSALAHNIFDDTIEGYGLAPGTRGRKEFDGVLRSFIGGPDFQRIGVVQVNFSASGLKHAEKAVEHYTREIANRVVGPLAVEEQGNKSSRGRPKRRPDSCNNDPAILVSMAMKLAGKLAHEIDRDDILRTANYEGDTIANTHQQRIHQI